MKLPFIWDLADWQTLLTGGIAESSHGNKKGKDREKGKLTTRDIVDEDASTSSVSAGYKTFFDPRSWLTQTTASGSVKKVASQHKVRISMQDRTLDSMFPVVNPAQISGGGDAGDGNDSPLNKSREIKESECYLSSVRSLRDAAIKGKHTRQ